MNLKIHLCLADFQIQAPRSYSPEDLSDGCTYMY